MDIAGSFIVDLINRKDFNAESLLGKEKPGNLDRFWRYSDNMYTYQKQLANQQEPYTI